MSFIQSIPLYPLSRNTNSNSLFLNPTLNNFRPWITRIDMVHWPKSCDLQVWKLKYCILDNDRENYVSTRQYKKKIVLASYSQHHAQWQFLILLHLLFMTHLSHSNYTCERHKIRNAYLKIYVAFSNDITNHTQRWY